MIFTGKMTVLTLNTETQSARTAVRTVYTARLLWRSATLSRTIWWVEGDLTEINVKQTIDTLLSIARLYKYRAAFQIGPHPAWGDPGKIVSLDPWGHLTIDKFASFIKAGLDVRPTSALTRAHIKLPDVEAAIAKGTVTVDGHVVLNKQGEIEVTKAAVDPVWDLPGVAARFNVDEGGLRRALL